MQCDSVAPQVVRKCCSYYWIFGLSFFLAGDLFLKSKGVSHLTPVVPSVQHFFSGVVIHHGVVAVLVCELYVGVPLFSCLGVVSKVDGSGPAVMAVDTVDHSTCDKSIAHRAHWFCTKKQRKRNALT